MKEQSKAAAFELHPCHVMSVLTQKVCLLDVVYDATSNELVLTKTLTKNTFTQIKTQPFRQWYVRHYGITLGINKKKKGE